MEQENKDVDESMGLFEAAFRARHIELSRPVPQSVAMIHDDSDQEETLKTIATAASRVFGAELREIEAPVLGMDAAEKVALFKQQTEEAGLIVLPAPFGENLQTLKSDSLSSVIDILLIETTKPVLIARHPVEDAASVLRRPVVLLDWNPDLQGVAASWACTLAQDDGHVDLVATIASTTLYEVEALFGGSAEDLEAFRGLVKRAETRMAGGVVAAVQKEAGARGFTTSFEVHEQDEFSTLCAGRACDTQGLVLCGYHPRQHSPSMNRVRDIILESRQPVLCLPVQ